MTRYWGQIAVASVAALGVAYWLFSSDHAPLTAALVGLLVYLTVRWLFAWAFRIRYWYSTSGNRSQPCPDCGQYVRRQRGDWVLQCHRCGWTRGLPGVRLLLYSVPARQFRRTVGGWSLVVVVLAVALVGSGVAGQVAISDITVPEETDSNENRPEQSENATGDDEIVVDAPEVPEVDVPEVNTDEWTTDTDTSIGGSDDAADLNFSLIRTLFRERLNEIRAQNGLGRVESRSHIREVANWHAEDMADNDYLGHTDSQGREPLQRWRDFYSQSRCLLDAGPGRERYGPAENAAYVGTFIDVTQWWNGEVTYIDSESDLVEFFVNTWMESEGHRENMLRRRASEIGLGLAADDNRVYASLSFC